MNPVVGIGMIVVGVLSTEPDWRDLLHASRIWPGVFPYRSRLDRIITRQALTGTGVPLTLGAP